MDVPEAYHREAGENSMLIQIMDNDTIKWPVSKHQFKEIHRFKFLDVEANTPMAEGYTSISDEQAKDLVELLQKALRKDMNVIVHCHAGVCRSGAVCEIGVILGFEDCKKYRAPNLLVKHKMMKVLGLYDYENRE